MHAIINNYRQEILEIAHQRGIMNVRVFGSMSRGDAGPDSDVDLLVQLESGRSGLALSGFLMDVSELLGRKADVVTEKALHPRLRGKIVQEAQPLVLLMQEENSMMLKNQRPRIAHMPRLAWII